MIRIGNQRSPLLGTYGIYIRVHLRSFMSPNIHRRSDTILIPVRRTKLYLVIRAALNDIVLHFNNMWRPWK